MTAVPSPDPARNTAGISTDFPWGPLADYGAPNPLFYHSAVDDFDPYVAGRYTTTGTVANGSIATLSGEGGLAIWTTNSSTPVNTDFTTAQLTPGGFTLTAGKKSFFLTRLQVSSAANAAFIVGLMQVTTTPFTQLEGLYFLKATGATTLVLRHRASAVNTDIAIPANANPLADATFIDLGWYVDRQQNIYAFVGGQLVGWIPQSGTGSVTAAGTSVLPVKGPIASLQQSITALTLTANVLTPTLALQSGTASSKTMTTDFWLAAKER